MEKKEYRVRPVTRYVLTEYSHTNESALVSTLGEFNNLEYASKICDAMQRIEFTRQMNSEPLTGEQVI